MHLLLCTLGIGLMGVVAAQNFNTPLPTAIPPAGAKIYRKSGIISAEDHEKGNKKDRVRAQAQNDIAKIKFKDRGNAYSGVRKRGQNIQGVHKDERGQTGNIGAQNRGRAGLAAASSDRRGKHNGVYRGRSQGNDQHAALSADDKRLDAVQRKRGGNVDKFEADSDSGYAENDLTRINSAGNNAAGKFKHQPKRGRDADMDWTYAESGPDVESSLKDNKNPRGFNRECEARKVGDSSCVNPNKRGENVKVTSDRAGNTVVRKNGVVVTKAHCEPQPGSPRDNKGNALYQDCKIADGVLVASVDKYSESDCMSEFGMPADNRVQIENPLDFNYAHKEDAEGKSFIFPSCFDMSSNINFVGFTSEELATVGKQLAVHYIAEILPAGKFQCKDAGSCEDSEDACHYCNWCQAGKKKRLGSGWRNFDGDALCGIGGQQRMRIKTTVCPPPEWEYPECSEFKQESGMWDAFKQGKQSRADLNVLQRFFLAPPNVEELRANCHAQVKNPIQKIQLQLKYLSSEYVKTLKESIGFSPNKNSDEQLKKYCLALEYQKYAGSQGNYDKFKGRLVGCKRAVVNYRIDGSNSKASNFLLKSVQQTGAVRSFFKPTRCPKVDRLENVEDAENARLDEEYLRQNPSSGGGGIIPNFGGGGTGGFGNFGNFGNFGKKK